MVMSEKKIEYVGLLLSRRVFDAIWKNYPERPAVVTSELHELIVATRHVLAVHAQLGETPEAAPVARKVTIVDGRVVREPRYIPRD
jgi:hypothetical protein